MNILLAFLFILMAGIVNGSFALPTKYVNKWKFENIWLQFAIWGFVILPWVITLILVPQTFQIYAATPSHLLIVILLGGLFFGIGQICFALSLNLIGLCLGFAINLSLGISLGFLLPLVFQHADKIMTPFGITTLAGTLLSVIGLIISNHAGILRDREKYKLQIAEQNNTSKSNNKHKLGVILAVIAGFSSAEQNFVFSLTYSMQPLAASMGANDFGAANIIWPGFLACGFIPYALYTLYLLYKNKSFVNYRQSSTGKYYIFAFIMGLFSYSSLLFYSKASQLIGGSLGPLIGWPMFMALIILVSSFWGWRYKEWEGCGNKTKKVMKQGLMFLILAIAVLAYSSSL